MRTPVIKDLVLIGGGHSHVAVLRRFGMAPMRGVRLTLIGRDVLTPYSGMLPGFIAGHYTFEDCHIDLAPLAAFAGARFYHDEAVGIDLAARHVLCAGRPPVAFDVLSLDIGSGPNLADVPGAAEHATPVKPINGFVAHWERILARVLADDRELRIGVVGGGAGGVELVLAMRHRLRAMLTARRQDPDRLRFVLITAGRMLATHSQAARRLLLRALEQRGVALHTDSPVAAVAPCLLRCVGGQEIPLDEILWVTQAGAASWPAASGLACDAAGFVRVRDTLQSVTDPAIFAAGDIAAVEGYPRPKAGVFAVRQGPPLAENLRRVLAGRPARPFVPQRRFLSLISTGDACAVASWGGLAFAGPWLWRLKDRIDRRFMRRFTELPAMPAAEPPAPAPGVANAPAQAVLAAHGMRCGGCAAKLSSDILSRVLARLTVVRREEVLIGLDAPDDAALVLPVAGMAQLHSADYFRAFIDDPYLFGRIAATHALGDIHAMGGDARTALAIATLPYGIARKIEDDLFQMLTGALAVLNQAGCALIGGHSSEGAELALGFALTGSVPIEAAWRKRGLVAGQALVLTKPIGTGALFAAAMRGRARGVWIDAALASMQISAAAAAACLRRFGATACTDVTGFGLAGHLAEMARASGVQAALDLASVPLLDGAPEVVRAGIVSTAQAQNMQPGDVLAQDAAQAGDPRFALLFDPQTAGGLLAGVPAERAGACVAALRRLGYPAAAVIGQVLGQITGGAPIRILEAPPARV
ncbi:MAG: selenide, water dikinase SelD [Rhodospirillales bacterium]|nr:selenide, water dikinase SelD [Rhodospirillales bacterium]